MRLEVLTDECTPWYILLVPTAWVSQIATFTVCHKAFRKLQSWIIIFSLSRKVCMLFCIIWKLWRFILKSWNCLKPGHIFKNYSNINLKFGKVPEITQSYKTDGFNMKIATQRVKPPHKICIFICIFQSSLMPNPLQSHLSATFTPNISLKWVLWNTEILVAVTENGWTKVKIAFPFHCYG